MSQQNKEERAVPIQQEINAITFGPRCPFCMRDMKAGVEIQGLHFEADGNTLCYGSIWLLNCQRCGWLIRTIFDTSHLNCQIESYEHPPAQSII